MPSCESVTPLPLWNRNTRTDKLDVPTKVLETKRVRNCESGVMFRVQTQKGKMLWLDSHWFKEYLTERYPSAGRN